MRKHNFFLLRIHFIIPLNVHTPGLSERPSNEDLYFFRMLRCFFFLVLSSKKSGRGGGIPVFCFCVFGTALLFVPLVSSDLFFCIGKRKKTTATLAAGAQCCLFKKNHKCVAANSPLTYALPISELATLRVNPSWVVERVETRVHH